MAKEEKEILIRISDIVTLKKQFDFKNPNILTESGGMLKEFAFEVRIGISALKVQPVVGLIVGISIFTDAAKTDHFGYYEIGISFGIQNIDDAIIDDRLFIPEQVLYTMVNTAIGTARGGLFAELKVSPFPNIYLPLITIKPIVEDIKNHIKDGLLFTEDIK